MAFALAGALIADNHGLNAIAGAAIGGAVGIIFGFVADGKISGGKVVDVLFTCGAVRFSCCERRAGQSVDPCRLYRVLLLALLTLPLAL